MQPRVSLCMIVKNEEANLPACLGCAADLVDEIIVVDTGSSDRTKEVAAGIGARVHDFVWVDSFAAARNESLRHATGEWVFWLDADDRLDEENRQRLRTLFASLGGTGETPASPTNIAYVMKVLCPGATQTGLSSFDHIRLFPNHPEARWRYRIHEQILPALEHLGMALHRSDVRILHTGYQDAALQAGKRERNLRLLHLENEEHPGDAFTLFNLAWAHQEMGRLPEALAYYRQSLGRATPNQSFVRKLYTMLARALRQTGQTAEALAICREGLTRYFNDTELLFQQAWLLYLFGDFYGAEACLLQILQAPPAFDGLLDIGVDPGLRSYVTRSNLAVLYRDQQRFLEAEQHWQAALVEKPDFSDALLGLGELYLAQGRWEQMEQVLTELQENPKTALQAAVLKAQQHLARQEFDAARELLNTTIAGAPQALGPRLVLSRLLWQEGRDWAAAEQALRDVLAIDPNHAEARANLARLRPAQTS